MSGFSFLGGGVAAPPPGCRVNALALRLRRIEPKVSTERLPSLTQNTASFGTT
nr:MAG TPA: hypothetical protein [Caudoviricetes sp.]